ncbi:MAG: DUF3108 domain-containing protein [Moraxellaceae bacterium]|nr:DUF3108 domain-containing protein [Moraxellaceae bacterium]
MHADDSLPTRRWRLTPARAVVLSVLLHFVVVIGSEITLPDLYTPPDEILSRQQPETVQRVRLSVAPKPKAEIAGPRFIAAPKPEVVEKKADNPTPETGAEGSGGEAAELQDIAPEAGESASTGSDESGSPAGAPLPPDPEPAPAFPVQLRAELELRFNGFTAIATQEWVMEGHRYAITVSGSKFGFKARLQSEGGISSDGGLEPERYSLSINDRVRNFAEYRNGVLTHGKPDNIRTTAVASAPQDMTSLPFHVAVTFTGKPQTLMVTTGNSVYEVRLVLDAEETIKLPAGTFRTLHLRGERFNPTDGTLLAGYEVWLAPDYLNYPVKFIGRTGKGDTVEYRVRHLELEGKTVLGESTKGLALPDDDDIPEWLRQRSEYAPGTSAPAAPAAPAAP